MLEFFGVNLFTALLLLAPLLQAAALFIETSSWLVRAQSTPDDMGLYVGRSNIYLYSARMFTLIFTASLAFAVESGQPSHLILQVIYVTFLLSALTHALLLFDASRERAISWIAGALLLPQRGRVGRTAGSHMVKGKLFWLTTATAIIFSISLTAPILGAILFPDYRLSISYIGQMINFFGTMIVLFLVDQILFRAIDTKTIDGVIMAYISGRLVGFAMVGLAFAYIGFNLWQ